MSVGEGRTAGRGSARTGGDRAAGSRPPGDPPTAAALDAVVREMADRMAHQLKNPLQAIAVNLEVMRVRAAAGCDEAELDRFARAVEEGVQVLDRRLRLLFLVARASGETTASVAPLGLVDDLVGALHLEREPGRVTVVRARSGASGVGASARLRSGHFVACLVRLLDLARERSAGEIEVRHDPDLDALAVRFEPVGRDPEPARSSAGASEGDEAAPASEETRVAGASEQDATAVEADRWREVVELARAAGAEAERRAEGGTEAFLLRFAGG